MRIEQIKGGGGRAWQCVAREKLFEFLFQIPRALKPILDLSALGVEFC